MSVYAEIIREHSRPLQPIPTGVAERLVPLHDVRVVLLDVYGTMFISASGEPQASGDATAVAGLQAACRACGSAGLRDAGRGLAVFREIIQRHHRREQQRGLEHPEVDIVQVWADWLHEMTAQGRLEATAGQIDPARLAVEYEVRANPVWPMPDLLVALRRILAAGVALGIISNAQFFTRELFAGLLGGTPEALGFDPDLQFYSFHHRQAKPGMFLYQLAAGALVSRGLAPRQALHVGNDLLNDIWPATRVGFSTALFAGDQRSLRWRDGDPRVSSVRPELVLTSLTQLADCVSGYSARPV